MPATAAKHARMIVCLSMLALAGCTQSTLRIAPDFGSAVRQDQAAQISDPDARYAGTPAPGSKGERVGLAQKRYDSNQVIQPLDVTASNEGVINNSNSSSSAGGNTNGVPARPWAAEVPERMTPCTATTGFDGTRLDFDWR